MGRETLVLVPHPEAISMPTLPRGDRAAFGKTFVLAEPI